MRWIVYGMSQRGKSEMKNKSEFLIVFLILIFSFIYASIAYADVLTLPDGLRLVTEENRLVKITLREEAVSEADTLLARSRMLPNINASLTQTFLTYQPEVIFGPQSVPMSEKNFLSYSLSIQQTLYDFKGDASRYESSKLILETKKIDTKRIRNLVSLDFTLIYFDILESEKMVIVAEKEVQRLESHLRDAKNLYDEGVITKNDLFQAEVRLSDVKQRLMAVRNLRAINASRLNSVLARPLKTDVQVMDVKETPSDGLNLDMEKAWELAESQRPEIQIVDTTLKSLDMEEAAKRSEYYPRFFLQGGYDFTENRYQVHEGNWSLTAGINLNLFSGGSTKAEVLKIKQQRLKLFGQRDKLIDEVKLEVEKYILDLKTAREKITVTKDAVGQAEENLRINRVRYGEGVGTATEVLDAVTLLTIAETNLYKSLYDFRRAEAGFIYSIGKDLSEVYK
jgi:outer membrane protein